VKFSVERDVLTDAVAWAARSLPVRPSAPVLAGLLIETDDSGDGLVLSTFDYETSARATLPASVTDEGKALVSGRLLADICRSLPNKPVHMSLDGAKVVLTCGQAKFTLQTMPVEEYPSLPSMPESTGSVSSDLFAQAVSQAVTAAGRDDMLPVLTGVRIEIVGGNVSLLATDRFRLSLRELEWNPGVQLMFDDNGLTLDAGHGDEAVATERIEAQVKGDPITTGFNPQFLLDGLGALDHPVVELAFTLPAKPAVITGANEPDGEKDTDFQYLLMPRRLLS
jgi:DNA polymerase III sliding clamp (beta) subunit (PCNA family)